MEPRSRASSDRVRQLILDLWSRTRIDWGFATDRLSETFRRERKLGSHERREVAETLYGMIRQARRLDFALDSAGAKITPGPRRELARYLAHEILEGKVTASAARAELPMVDWERVARVDEVIDRERDGVRRLALRRSLPDWLAARFVKQMGPEADALAAALNARAPLTIRANTLKNGRDELAEILKKDGVVSRPTRFAAQGLELETRVNVFGLQSFQDGRFEVQDEASQLVAEAVAPGRGLVVDACAGAGGKSLALGALMGSKGKLVATDVAGQKLEELRRRARRAGLSNLRAVEIQEDHWPDEVMALVGRAERVLVDAPCSGIGALRRNPEARWRLVEEDLERLPRQQLAIATKSARLVMPGGLLIYATCTILKEENEEVVRKLLEALHDFERVPLAETLGSRAADVATADGLALATWPHKHGMDGFYAAVLRRKKS